MGSSQASSSRMAARSVTTTSRKSLLFTWCCACVVVSSSPVCVSSLRNTLREDDLPQVLRSPASPCHQLPQAQVWTHIKHPPQEEVKVNGTRSTCYFTDTEYCYTVLVGKI